MKPETLIEHNGYVYKLLVSKEEQLKIDARKIADREKNFGAFKQKLGTKQYEYLHTKGVTLSYHTGGNYSVQVFFDFENNLTWKSDEYSTDKKLHFGDSPWYNYDSTDFKSAFLSDSIYKMVQDYFFKLLTEGK